MKTTSTKKYNIILIILSFIIPSAIALLGLLSGSYAPFGLKNTICAAGYNDYIPYYYELYDRFHEGNLFGYSHISGLGYDFTSLLAYYISDPVNFLIVFFPRNSIIAVLDILYAIRIGLAGSFMSLYLSYKKNQFWNNYEETNEKSTESDKKDFVIGFKSIPDIASIRFIMTFDWIVLATSCIYALCISMIGTGMNVAYIGAIALLPLVMLGIDKIIYEKKIMTFVIFMSLSVYSNIHISIITIIFIIFYLLTRDYEDISHILSTIKNFVIASILSVLCSGVVIVGSIQGGFFVKDNTLMFPSVLFGNPMNSVRQLLSQSSVSAISMYGTSDIAVCTLGIFLLICYILQNKIKISTKIKNIALLLFVLSGTCVSTTAHLFNGFNLPAKNKVEFGYIICFIFIVIIFEEIPHLHELNIIKILLSFIVSGVIIFSPLFFADGYEKINVFIKTLEYLFGYFFLLLIFNSKSMTKTLYYLLTSIIIIAEVSIPYIQNSTDLGNFYLSQKLDNIQSIQLYEAAHKIQNNEDGKSVLIYNPLNSNDTPFTIDLSGYDYVIAATPFFPDASLELISKDKKEKALFSIYTYNNSDGIKHIFYPKDTENFIYNAQNPYDSSNNLAVLHMNGKHVFDLLDVQVAPSLASDGSSASFEVSFNAIEGDVYFNAYSASFLCNAAEVDNVASVIQNVPKSNNLNINYIYSAAVINSENYNDFLNITKNNSVVTDATNNSFTINAPEDGYVSTDYSNISALSFSVNGKKVKPISIINNNALVPVKAGDNKVEVNYSYKYIIISAILAIITIILSFVLSSKKKKGNNEDKVATDDGTDKESKEIGLKKTKKVIINFVTDNFVYIVTVSIILFVFILCQMITSSIPFGAYYTIKDDGFAQYYTLFSSYIDSVKEGELLPIATFNVGGFSDTYRYTIQNIILCPWVIATFSVIPKSLYMELFVLFYIGYMLLPALSIIFYLTKRHAHRYDKHDKRLIIYALLYTLSSYLEVFFPYYVGFRYLAYLPLIILGLEQLIYNNKKALYVCMLTLMMFFDVYASFLVCEFLVLYFFTLKFDSFKDFIKKGLSFSLGSIISALLTSFILLPFFYMTRLSPYMETDSKNPEILKFYKSFFEIIAQYHPGNAISAVSENDSQAATYCGLIILFIIPLYLMNRSFSMKEKIKKIALILLLFVATNNEMLNYILHGFHFQTLAPNRFAAYIIFLLITIVADIDLGKTEYNRTAFLFTILLASAFISLMYTNQYETLGITIKISYILVATYVITAFIIYANKSKNIQHYLLYIAVIDILINAVIVFSLNIGSKSEIVDTVKRFDSLAEKYPDMHDFDTITEYITMDHSYKNAGKISKMNTLSFFDSVFTIDTMNYIGFFNIDAQGNSITYKGNPLADMMLKVKYNIENTNEDTSYSLYPTIFKENEYALHENPNYISLGFVMPDTEILRNLNKDDYNDSYDFQNTFSKAVGSDKIYTKISCEKKTDSTDENSTYFTNEDIYEHEEGNTKIKKYLPTNIHLSEDYNGTLFVEYDDTIYLIGSISEANRDTAYDYPLDDDENPENFKPNLAIYNPDSITKLHDILDKNKLTKVKKNGNRIEAELNSDQDGMLYISLPYYEGWTIYVDGQKVEKEHFLGGMGVKVTSGNHTISMKYISPYSIPGIAISSLTALIIMICGIIRVKKNQNLIEK